MSAAFTLQGNVRNLSPESYSSGENKVDTNPRGDLCVAQGLPHKAELARLQKSWSMTIPTGSAFTNVANMPTTRAELLLGNNYSNDTCLVIDTVYGLSLTSITAASGFTLIYQVIPAGAAGLTNDTTVLINSPLGLTYSGSAIRDLALTTATANKWTALASENGGAAASIGCGCFAEVNGGIIVLPGDALALNWVVGTATGTSLIGVSWHEVVLPTSA